MSKLKVKSVLVEPITPYHEFPTLKVKRLSPSAILPSRAHAGDAGLDLYTTGVKHKEVSGKYVEYGTGIAVAIPEGHVGLLFARSSISNTALMLRNAVGVIDAGYRGEVTVRLYRIEGMKGKHYYDPGERIAQLVIVPVNIIEPIEVDDLPASERGEGGYGSSGK